MKLEKYLEENDITQEVFAQKLGIKPLAIYRYIRGDRKPHKDIAAQIVKKTKGAVTYEDLYA